METLNSELLESDFIQLLYSNNFTTNLFCVNVFIEFKHSCCLYTVALFNVYFLLHYCLESKDINIVQEKASSGNMKM